MTEGSILMKEIEVPLYVQEWIFPDILRHIPTAYKQIGISFSNYWDYDPKTRKEFLIVAVRKNLYPTVAQLKRILIKEFVSPLSELVKWTGPNSDKGPKWNKILKKTYGTLTLRETQRVWDRLPNFKSYLISYVRRDFLPLVLNDDLLPSHGAEIAKRLKEEA